MSKQAISKIVQECDACKGTGLYSGFAEAKGEAVICGQCEGRGWHYHVFRSFVGRKKKGGIKAISVSKGSFLATGVGAVGKKMTYAEFEKRVPVKLPSR